MPRYRYVRHNALRPHTLLSDCMLLSARDIIFHAKTVRITLPDDVELTRQPDGYSITDDIRHVMSLDPTPIIKVKGKWRKAAYLSTVPINQWDKELARRGYYLATDPLIGYLHSDL